MKKREELNAVEIAALKSAGVYGILYGDEDIDDDEGLPTLTVVVGNTHSDFVQFEHIDDNNNPTCYVKEFLEIMFDAYYHMGFLNKLTVEIGGCLIKNDKVEFDPVLYAQMLSNDLT